MATTVAFTTSRPSARGRAHRPESGPMETTNVKQEHSDDDLHPTPSTSFARFGKTVENPIELDHDDIKIKQETNDDSFITVDAWGGCGLTGNDPIILDDEDVMIKQEPLDDIVMSVEAWGGCGLTNEDPIVLDNDVVTVKQEPHDDSFISVDAWGGRGLTGRGPIILDDGDFMIKAEPKDDNLLSVDAWGDYGYTDQEPIILDDDENRSNFQPAHVESASPSEAHYYNEVPRNARHVLSSVERSCSQSPGDNLVTSVEDGQDLALDGQISPIYESVENEVDVNFEGADREPSTEHKAAATVGEPECNRSNTSSSEGKAYPDSSASTHVGPESNFEAEGDKESSKSRSNKFILALNRIRGQRNIASESTADEPAESKPLKKENSQECLNQSPTRSQAAEQQDLSPTPPLTSESQPLDENARAAREYEQFVREYNAKKAAGDTRLQDDIEYIRRQCDDKARRKRVWEEALQAPSSTTSPAPEPDPREEDWQGRPRYPEETLFCTPPPPRVGEVRSSENDGVPNDANDDSLDQDNVQDHAKLEVRPARGRKRTWKADDAESTLASALTTANKKCGRPVGVRNGQGKGRKKAAAKGRGKKADAVPRNRLLDTASLLTSDPIRDVNANKAEPATYVDATAGENGPKTKRKDEALKRLLASVPLDQKKTAQLDRQDLLAATKHFLGHGACKVDGAGGWLVGGMKTSLKNYQVLGAGFMRQRERGVDEPTGGLCSDSMGLGKTVMTLANIVNDHVWRKRIQYEGPKTTLIVVPSSLIAQWRSEIDKHVRVKDIKMRIMIYRSGSRIDSNDNVNDLAGYDIILTTWNEVMRSFPKGEIPLNLQTSQEKQEWWQEFFDNNKGLLHTVEFRRVVLDEAQAIKNHKGRTSLACRQLTAHFRWALSGTPILNTPLELYAYFKFLRVPSTGSYRIFKANYYGNNDPEKLQRLEIMLQKFMIRRTHKDSLFGAPILKLPETDENFLECQFNDTERAIYDIVRRRMIARINSFSRDNTLQRNYSNILVMLLRLRQMTGNILLVETVMRDLLEREDHEKLAQLANVEVLQDEQREAQIVALRRILAENTNDDPEEPSSSPRNAVLELPDRDEEVNTGRGHGLQFNFSKYLCSLQKGRSWEELQARTLCSECRNPPHDPMVTSCYHIYCNECLESVQHRAALKGLERARCTSCQNEYSKSMPCDDYTLESVIQSQEMESDNEGPTDKHWKRKLKRGKKSKDDNEAVSSWIEMNGAILPSAKTIAIKAQILNWLDAKPDCKIIIYTQFLSMIRILSKVCNQEGWGYVEYHGKMSLAQRDATIDRFRQDKDAKIMLASLKCGGIGLNLTMASQVAIVDSWWNCAVEQQAFGRVLRIGQTENTALSRFIVKGTIDEQLIAMQKRKQTQIDAVMGDADPNKKLSIGELLQLFGQVEEDGQGKSFIVVENKHTVPRFNQDSEDEGDED